MKLKLSLKKRIKQLFCKHDQSVGWAAYTKGVNRKEGHWYMEYHCRDCGFAYGKWIKCSEDEISKYFDEEEHDLG